MAADPACADLLIKAPDSVPTQDSHLVATSFGELLSHHNAPHIIDFLSLDIEGHEFKVLKYFPFGDYVFRAMTLERPTEELQALLKRHNYSYVRHLDMVVGETLDQLWVHESMRPWVTQRVLSKSCPKRNGKPSCLRGEAHRYGRDGKHPTKTAYESK